MKCNSNFATIASNADESAFKIIIKYDLGNLSSVNTIKRSWFINVVKLIFLCSTSLKASFSYVRLLNVY